MDDSWSPKQGRRRSKGSDATSTDLDILGDLLKDDSSKKAVEDLKPKKSGIKSSKNDNFYSSLSNKVEDPGSDVSDVDAEELAKTLGDVDDLDAELFSKKKITSRPSSKSSSLKKSEKSVDKKVTFTDSYKSPKEEIKPIKNEPLKSRPTSKFEDFDENDPLAGLLSDDDSDQRLTLTKKVQPLPQKQQLDDSSELKKGVTSGSRHEVKPKDFDFDDDDVLGGMGLDDTPPKTRDHSVDQKEKKKKSALDVLLGVEDQPNKSKRTALDDLLGKKEAQENKPKLTMLDEILGKSEEPFSKTASNEDKSSSRTLRNSKAERKEDTSKKDMEDFSFGDYMPSAIGQASSERRRSGRSIEDDTIKKSLESKTSFLNDSDGIGVAKRRDSKQSDWLGLKEDSPAQSTYVNSEPRKRKTSLELDMSRPSSGADWLDIKDSPVNVIEDQKPHTPDKGKTKSQSFTDWLGVKDGSNVKSKSDSDWLVNKESNKKTEQSDWLGLSKEFAKGSRQPLKDESEDDVFQKSLPWEQISQPRRTSLIEELSVPKKEPSDITIDSTFKKAPKVETSQSSSEDIGNSKPLVMIPHPHLQSSFSGMLSSFPQSSKGSPLAMIQSNLNRLNAAVSDKQQLLLHQEQAFHIQQEELLHQQEQHASVQLQLLQQQEEQLKNFQLKQKELLEQQLKEQQVKQELELQRLQHLMTEQQKLLMQQQMQVLQPNISSNLPVLSYVNPNIPLSSHPETELQAAVLRQQLLNLQTSHHKVVLDSSEELIELRTKAQRLEIERDHLSAALETCRKRFQEEITAIEASHQKKIDTIEEAAQRRENRWKDENELLLNEHISKSKSLELEKAELIASHYRKLEDSLREHSQEIERLKEHHRKGMADLKKDHEESIVRLRKIKDQEIDAVQSAQSHSRSIENVIDQVHRSTKSLEDLQIKVEAKHQLGLEDKTISFQARNDQLRVVEERFKHQQQDYEIERTRLQELLTKMEVHVREQSRQVDEERWNLKQEQNRLQQLQLNIEEERKLLIEQMNKERQDLQKSKDALIVEQKSTLKQLHEERQALALERAQVDLAQRLHKDQEQKPQEPFKSLQAEVEIEATLKSLVIEKSRLATRAEELRREAEKLMTDRLMLDQVQKSVELEKEKLSHLGLQVKNKSEEIEEMCQTAVHYHEEGQAALLKSKKVQAENEIKQQQLQSQLQFLRTKERQLTQIRIQINQERKDLDSKRNNMLCVTCRTPVRDISYSLPAQLPSVSIVSPQIVSATKSDPRLSLVSSQTEMEPSFSLWKLSAKKEWI